MFRFRFLLLLLTFVFPLLDAGASDCPLYHSVAQSPYTYYYRISNEEMGDFVRQPRSDRIYRLLHSRVDSSLTSSGQPVLPVGHYVKVFTKENKVHAEVFSVQPFFPYVMNNGSDLMVRVLDTLGHNMDRAEVTVGNRKLKYDRKMQAYVLPNRREVGVLSVRSGDKEVFARLSSGDEPSVLSQSMVIGESEQEDGYSFFAVTSQPKYRLQDTVRFKLFLHDRKDHTGLNVPIRLSIVQRGIEKEVGRLTPYAPGLFQGTFVLDDTLGLMAGENVTFSVTSEKDASLHAVRHDVFRCEEYSLPKARISLRAPHYHLRGDSLDLSVRATNENGYPLRDAELMVRAQFRNDAPVLSSHRQVFMPNTLWEKRITLPYDGESQIRIPWQCMPEANFSYTLSVALLNGDTVWTEECLPVTYIFHEQTVEASVLRDHVRFSYRENRKERPVMALIRGFDVNGKQVTEHEGELPFNMKLDPYVNFYQVQTGSHRQTIRMDSTADSLDIIATRKPSAVVFESRNPRSLPFNWFVYQGNKLVKKGSGTTFRSSFRKALNKDYYCTVQYLWGGRIRQREVASPFFEDDRLHLQVTQTPFVSPGQVSDVNIVALQKDKPVAGVDITAWAPIFSLGNASPDYPREQQNEPSERRKTVQYHISDGPLVHEFEMKQPDTAFFGRLDTIERYRFLYPDTPFYRTRLSATFSQIAPFVMRSGQPVPVHVVYIDHRPVYLSFVTNRQPYSCLVVPGRHSVWVRTADFMYDLGIIEVPARTKLILSLDADRFSEKVPYTSDLTDSERKELLSSLMPLYSQSSRGLGASYLVQGYNVFNVQSSLPDRDGYRIVGPLRPSQTSFRQGRKGSLFDFEPHNAYDATAPDTLRLSPYDFSSNPFYQKFSTTPPQSVSDSVYTVDRLLQEIARGKAQRRDNARIDYPFFRRRHLYDDSLSRVLLHNVVFLDDDSVRHVPMNYVAMSRDSVVTDLFNASSVCLTPGSHVLYALFPDQRYATLDLHVRKGFSSVLHDTVLVSPPSPRSRTYSRFLDLLVQTIDTNSWRGYRSEVAQLNRPLSETQAYLNFLMTEKDTAYHNGRMVGGFVRDDANQAVAGARVFIREYGMTVFTDFSGFFSFLRKDDQPVTILIQAPRKRTYELLLRHSRYVQPEQNLDVVLTTSYDGWTDYEVPKRFIPYGDTVSLADYSDVEPLRQETSDVSIVKRSSSRIASASSLVPVTEKGWEVRPVYVVDGAVVNDIDDVPLSSILKMERLRRAPSIYGARGREGGVILVTTNRRRVSPSSVSLSTDSSDETCAFWQPHLRTDKDGRVSFQVQWPDGVTRWRTLFIGVKGSQSASYAGDVLVSPSAR